MKEKEPKRPTHATGEEYHKVLSGWIDQEKAKAERQAAYAENGPPKRSNPFHVFFMVVILAGLVGWNVYYLNRPVESAPPENQRRLASIKLYHTASAIERYRTEQGGLPSDLATLNVPSGDYRYERGDTGYTLTLRTEDTSSEYRSGDDLMALLERAGVKGDDETTDTSQGDSGG